MFCYIELTLSYNLNSYENPSWIRYFFLWV